MVLHPELVRVLLSNKQFLGGLTLGQALTFLELNFDSEDNSVIVQLKEPRWERGELEAGMCYMTISELARLSRVHIGGQAFRYHGRRVRPLRDIDALTFIENCQRFARKARPPGDW